MLVGSDVFNVQMPDGIAVKLGIKSDRFWLALWDGCLSGLCPLEVC